MQEAAQVLHCVIHAMDAKTAQILLCLIWVIDARMAQILCCGIQGMSAKDGTDCSLSYLGH